MKKFLNLEFALSFLLPITGVSCILFSSQITSALPYILGIAMIVGGGIRVVSEIMIIVRREEHAFNLGANLIMTVLGVLFVIRGAGSLMLIGIIWGLIGVWHSAVSFQRAANQLHKRERFAGNLILGLFRLVVAVLLLLEPEHASISHHVILLGIDILVDTARMPFRRLKRIISEKRKSRSDAAAAGSGNF